MAAARATIDHDKIRKWVEKRGGHPAAVRRTGRGEDPGILRIDFPGFSGGKTLTHLDWDTFFRWFDENELAFLYQDATNSRFNKLIGRRHAKLDGARARGNGARPPESEAPRTHAIRLLERQHREVEALFEAYEDARGPRQKERAFVHLADILAAHAKIEETIFYPSVLSDATEDELRESLEEHLVMKRLLADLMDLSTDDPQFHAKMHVLREVTDRHVAEEEHRLFEMLSDIPDDVWFELGDMMLEGYELLLEHDPHKDLPKETGAAPML